ncbi:MAG: SMP-30/gluconolactonase/LRE family protein [Promethearchaeota archaeon]
MEPKVLLSNLQFPEGPRWRNGKLFFSDAAAGKVIAVDEEGNSEILVEVKDLTSGLGFLKDGRMLIVSMQNRHLMRLDPDGLKIHADLSKLTEFNCNDCVTDAYGRTYVGNWGTKSPESPASPTCIILVTKGGDAKIVAEGLLFPNGCVVTPDCKTFIVGETQGNRLTAFDIEPTGDLTNRRIWAELEGCDPDGICLDEEGAIWVANPARAEVIRVLEGGEITSTIKVKDTNVYACCLGGADGRTLFLCTNQLFYSKPSSGRIEYVKIKIPGVEIP